VFLKQWMRGADGPALGQRASPKPRRISRGSKSQSYKNLISGRARDCGSHSWLRRPARNDLPPSLTWGIQPAIYEIPISQHVRPSRFFMNICRMIITLGASLQTTLGTTSTAGDAVCCRVFSSLGVGNAGMVGGNAQMVVVYARIGVRHWPWHVARKHDDMSQPGLHVVVDDGKSRGMARALRYCNAAEMLRYFSPTELEKSPWRRGDARHPPHTLTGGRDQNGSASVSVLFKGGSGDLHRQRELYSLQVH
jgi:hypothetical protein